MNNELVNWKKREGVIKESVWLVQGIKLYRNLLAKEPDNIEYKMKLANLMTRSGSDEKLRYMNLNNAAYMFKEVLELFPHHAEALYRLGHICYENKDYNDSIEFFSKAVEQTLEETKLFRSYATMSKAYYYLKEEGWAKNYLHKAIEADKGKNFTNEINEVESLVTQNGHYTMMVRYADGVTHLITAKAAESLKDEDVNEVATLDVRPYHSSFSGPIDTVSLERKEAEILAYLVERDYKVVSIDELFNIWEIDEEPEVNTIKSHISKIRGKVRKCLPESKDKIITNKRGVGYRWICPIPVNITKTL
ncbi:tetratricopeptide repeat protein [Bacillus sp. HMF5848]|uniref:winged helix-turn-helix domain-containing protein n=1 Tax=Bacillus sp. HMF5848 TaxID=2495421 RepID=UPI000F76F98D|nr:winged helix-turn-helix domain-containing protein [Bacillus sp. HMF5848]RSK27626.1 tetratricopeptide repeat protein [Bacillus sp. HMF5848]